MYKNVYIHAQVGLEDGGHLAAYAYAAYAYAYACLRLIRIRLHIYTHRWASRTAAIWSSKLKRSRRMRRRSRVADCIRQHTSAYVSIRQHTAANVV